jgi:hypothetical protein
LLPLLTVFGVATALLIVTVQLRLPTWAFFVPGAVAGATITRSPPCAAPPAP